MPTLREDAETVLNFDTIRRFTDQPEFQVDAAAVRLARAYLRAFRVRTVSENCHDLAIVDADHYEALVALAARTE